MTFQPTLGQPILAQLTLAVTGATGFVGGHTLTAAVARGHRVRALTRRPQAEKPGVTWISGALDDGDSLARLVDGADAVIHVAGVTNARTAAGFHAGNVTGTANLLAVLEGRPLVHVSSLSTREPHLSVYGASKLAGERLALAAPGPVAAVRPPGVYGPGDTQFLPLFRAARLRLMPLPAGARASMIFGADLGDALVALAEDLAGPGRANGQCYEVDDGHHSSAGHGYALADIARTIGTTLGVRVRPFPVAGGGLLLGAAIATLAARITDRLPSLSFDRARYLAHRDWTANPAALLGLGIWQPRTSLADGMAQTRDWYRREGVLR